MRLPGNNVSVLRVAHNVVQFGREVGLDGPLGAIAFVVFRRHLHLRVVPVCMVDHRLLYLDLLPFPGRIIIVGVHHVLCWDANGINDVFQLLRMDQWRAPGTLKLIDSVDFDLSTNYGRYLLR